MRRVRVLHDLRSRPGLDSLLGLLSAVAVLTAVLGPLLLGALEESTLTTAVAAAGAPDTAVTLTLAGAEGPLGNLPEVAGGILTPVVTGPSGRLWQAPRTWVESSDDVAWAARPRTAAPEAVSRVGVLTGDCTELVLVAGRCPGRRGEALLSVADARQQGLRVGATLGYRVPAVPQGRQARLVGTYDPARSALPLTRVTADPLLLPAADVAALPLPVDVRTRMSLRPGLRLRDAPAVRASVLAVNDSMLDVPYPFALDTGLVDLLDRVDVANRDARVLVGIVEVQALALAVAAVAVVLQRLARARTAEWSVGRLRGIPRRRWLASMYAEPAVALLVGVPVGVGAGVLVARLSVLADLPAGTPVELWRWPVLAPVGATVLAAGVALVAVSGPNLRRPLVELIAERSEPRRLTRLGAVVQALAVLSAAATLYELRLGGVLSTRGPQLGLLAPVLFSLALAVVILRVAVLVVRRVTSRPPRSLVALVVGRQVVRTPSALNPVVVLAVGVSLAVFATQVLALSVRNQDLRAQAVVGADTVLQVGVPAGVDLVTAVRAADPQGQWAMAAQERVARTDRGTSRLVAVDSSRLAAVSPVTPGWTGVEDLAAALHPPTPAPITLRGSRVSVVLGDVQVTPGPVAIAGTAPADPELTLVLDTGRRWQTVQLGPVGSGPRLSGPISCRSGCRLLGFGLVSPPGAPYRATVTIESVATDVQPAAASHAWLGGQGRWHARIGGNTDADPVAKAAAAGYERVLTVTASDEAGGNAVGVAPADVLDPLPAVLAPATDPDPYPGLDQVVFGNGLDGQPQLLRVVGHASVLPRSLSDGVLVDLAAAAALSDPADDGAVDEVWLGPGAPASAEQALVAAGLTVQSRERLADVRSQLQQQPATRAAAVAVSLAEAALLLSLLALVTARVADLGRRRADWRALRDGGLAARTVRRLAFAETVAPALLGTALGLVAGVAALRLAAARLPLVDLSRPGPPLDLHLAEGQVGLVALVVLAVVLVGAALGAAAESR